MSTMPDAGAPRPVTQRSAGRLLVTDLEVITLTPTSAVISWLTRAPWRGGGVPRPIPAGSQLWLGPADGSLALVHDDDSPRAFHSVEVTGLEPGRRYRFRASSGGQQATAGLRPTRRPDSPERVGEFTTLLPPPGRYLTSLALVNDIHIGERRQGIVLGPLPTSVRPQPDAADYPELMFSRTLEDLAGRRGRPMLLANGDLTYANLPDEVTLARRLLDDYGTEQMAWVATRGNHDHPRAGDDPFGDAFVAYQRAQTVQEASGLRILALDSTRGSGGGWILPTQYEQAIAELDADPERPTLMATHHPATNEAAWSAVSGPQFMLRGRDRQRLQLLQRAHRGVFLHVSGHTHRMRRDRADLPGAHTQYLETAACAAYPGGYTMLHLYEGGYLVNFWRPTQTDVLDWLFRSRWQAMGLGAHVMLGSTADRNHVVQVDLTGLTPSGRDVPHELQV